MSETCTYRLDDDRAAPGSDDADSLAGWSCHREAQPESEFCLFHLPEEEREALGVEAEAVGSALRRVAATEGETEKRLIGARLGDVDLAQEILEAADKHPLDLRYATITGAFDLRGASVEQPIDLRSATVDEVAWDEATFHEEVRFADGAVREAFGVRGTEFDADADFEGVAFEGATDFAEARFRGDTCLRDTRFLSSCSFDGVEFQGDANLTDDDVCFERARFDERVTFRKATFRYADFIECDFGGETVFDESTFTADAEFTDAAFARRASFRGVVFEGDADVLIDDADFEGVTFAADATFEDATFALANFADAEFGGEATFRDVTFEEEARFPGADFEAAIFEETRFYDDVALRSASFARDATFRGAEFHGGDNVDDEDLTLAGATFDGEADFERAEFSYAEFEGVTFGEGATFLASTFEGDAVFEEATFADEATFEEARFLDDADFQAARFEGDARFQGAEFHGGDNVRKDDVSFEAAVFEASASFHRAEFEHANLAAAEFRAEASFEAAIFGRRADFEAADFGDDATFTEVRFRHDASFAGATFDGEAAFPGAEFQGGAHTVEDADFEAVTFGSTANFEQAEFRSASFMSVVAEGPVLFKETRFGDEADFENATFHSDAVFSRSAFDARTRFASCRFEGEAHFDELQFRKDTTFADAAFQERATFRAAEFEGSANMHNDDASFKSATFAGEATFDKASFLYANFAGTTIGESCRLSNVVFERSVTLRPTPAGDEALVDLAGAVVESGTLGQPEEGNVFYDLTDAEIHEVSLDDENCEHDLFDHFRFCNTDFIDFDFTAHKAGLARNNWVIHRFEASEDLLDGERGAYLPSTLEFTYLKAKNCASDFGDRKAAAEFFIKEMYYRRKKNWRAAFTREEDVTPTNRAKALGKWFGNYVLHQTCGYGERLWRVVYVSAVAVVFWAILYTTTSRGTTGGGPGPEKLDGLAELATTDGLIVFVKNLYFSLITFTTVGFGGIRPVGTTARMLAGLEAFFGALLVALVVFVLGRRVAW
ncbi:MAG: pentapeptide repeat-containing protein [Haloquadratum sp.]